MSSLTDRELKDIQHTNASGKQPVVFVHGLWLLPSSWGKWREHFEVAGYQTLAPGWPDDPATVEEARARPEVFAQKSLKQISGHYAELIGKLNMRPAIVGHSFGGAITQMLAGQGRSIASVAIDPAPFRGVLPLPISALKSAAPVLTNPANYGRAVSLTFEQFQFGWANAVSPEEAKSLYETYHVPGAGKPLFQAAFANLNPWTDDKVDTRNPNRGPMLLISGEKDNTVPWAIVSAEYEQQKQNPAVTEVVQIPNRGHSLTIDNGWKDVADLALKFVSEHAPARK